jgi:hypothetical protein
VQNSVREMGHYKHEWLQQLQRMDTNRIPKQTQQYKPKGVENGRPEVKMEGPASL